MLSLIFNLIRLLYNIFNLNKKNSKNDTSISSFLQFTPIYPIRRGNSSPVRHHCEAVPANSRSRLLKNALLVPIW